MAELTTTDVRRILLDAIAEVAPELEGELPDLDPTVDLWRELELDSMDHLTVMTRLSEATGRDIPERDYPKLGSVDAVCAYLT
jgi:acyl carrier protein